MYVIFYNVFFFKSIIIIFLFMDIFLLVDIFLILNFFEMYISFYFYFGWFYRVNVRNICKIFEVVFIEVYLLLKVF